MRSRFEVDSEDLPPQSSAVLVDPEQYDATEEQFSASLEVPAVSGSRFIPDQPSSAEEKETLTSAAARASAEATIPADSESSGEVTRTPAHEQASSVAEKSDRGEGPNQANRAAASSQPHASASPDSWKEELAARLNSYRAKRKPRPPKYPSLSLDFEPPVAAHSSRGARASDTRTSLAIEDRQQKLSMALPEQRVGVVLSGESAAPSTMTPASARVIEFPRFFSPETSPDQLAEPVCEHPRILDAPEVELPAPALGGIVLDSTEEESAEQRPGFEVPLRSAPIAQRIFAAAVDLVVILAAAVMFGYIFLQLAKGVPAGGHLLASAALVATVLWAGYQYLLLTYSGTTPGLRVARLQLIHFDGSAVARGRRRWRVLALLLSALSLGLGFVWCFLDEDALCWHDRITRTHLVPRD